MQFNAIYYLKSYKKLRYFKTFNIGFDAKVINLKYFCSPNLIILTLWASPLNRLCR